jgi:hypothetical protein
MTDRYDPTKVNPTLYRRDPAKPARSPQDLKPRPYPESERWARLTANAAEMVRHILVNMNTLTLLKYPIDWAFFEDTQYWWTVKKKLDLNPKAQLRYRAWWELIAAIRTIVGYEGSWHMPQVLQAIAYAHATLAAEARRKDGEPWVPVPAQRFGLTDEQGSEITELVRSGYERLMCGA